MQRAREAPLLLSMNGRVCCCTAALCALCSYTQRGGQADGTRTESTHEQESDLARLTAAGMHGIDVEAGAAAQAAALRWQRLISTLSRDSRTGRTPEQHEVKENVWRLSAAMLLLVTCLITTAA